jgi:alkanesulfonate monooxygenase SsuD/methylene tetrahydromethanopterin reductase-like flavin-dependent oxidoreductase (luciferase family)
VEVFGKALSFDAVGDARRAEAAGYDGVRAIDHVFSGIPPEPPIAVPHVFTTLGAAAVATSRVRLTQTMVAATLRHPVEVAQAVATLSRISGGRAELGLGTGWLQAEHDATGLRLGPVGERVDRLVEAVTVCGAMLRGDGTVAHEGTHFRAVVDAPWPALPGPAPILVGAHGPVVLRRLAPLVDRIDLVEGLVQGRATFAGAHRNDAEALAGRMALARKAAADAGAAEPVFSATVNLTVCGSEEERDAARGHVLAASGEAPAGLEGELLRLIDGPDAVLAAFATLAGLGVDRVHVRPADAASQVWLDEALPALHAL